MHFQIDNIEPKILDPMKYDIDAEKFLKESFC